MLFLRSLPILASAVETYNVPVEKVKKELVSPGYPNTYPANKLYNWILTAENGSYVYMKNMHFSTHDSNDYIQIHDHATDEIIWTDHGGGKAGVFLCGTGGLRVYWHVNSVGQSGSWKFEYWTGEIQLQHLPYKKLQYSYAF